MMINKIDEQRSTKFLEYMIARDLTVSCDLFESWDETISHTIELDNCVATVTSTIDVYLNKPSYMFEMFYNSKRRTYIPHVYNIFKKYDLNEKIVHAHWDIDLHGHVPDRPIKMFREINKHLKNNILNGIHTKPVMNLIVVSHPHYTKRKMIVSGKTGVKNLKSQAHRLGFGNLFLDNRVYLRYDENLNPISINEED